MRLRFIVQIFAIGVIMAGGAFWLKTRAVAIELQARLTALAARQEAERALLQTRDRLRSEMKETTLQRDSVPVTASPGSAAAAAPTARDAFLALGEWTPVQEWRNEGRATPQAAVDTLLWAAAGGDVAVMTSLLEFDEAAKKQAQDAFEALPPAARELYPTPEALVAGLTIAAVPNNAAELSWFHQRDEDHATIGLLLGDPSAVFSPEVIVADAKQNRPGMLTDHGATKLAVLSLQRSNQGWQILIPAGAIKGLVARATRMEIKSPF